MSSCPAPEADVRMLVAPNKILALLLATYTRHAQCCSHHQSRRAQQAAAPHQGTRAAMPARSTMASTASALRPGTPRPCSCSRGHSPAAC